MRSPLKIFFLFFLFSTNLYAQRINFSTLLDKLGLYGKTENDIFRRPLLTDQYVASEISKFWTQLVNENRVFYWEISDRNDRTPHYCAEECSCIQKSLKKYFDNKQRINNLRIYFLNVYPVETSNVLALKMNGKFRSYHYFYHSVTLIEYYGSLGVYDPLLFGNEMVPLGDWFNKAIGNGKDRVMYGFGQVY
ncbi:MAG: hypothetical protein QE271_05220 [Bacteriovoracaceae bacterium]|nr:hypothetical protein [Bacteriovoracaceae bacterium]